MESPSGQFKEICTRSEAVWNCRKAAISADPIFKWKLVDAPKSFYTRHLLRQTTFTPDTFYTRSFLHQTPYTRSFLHQTPFTPDTFYTRRLYTRHSLRQTTFTPDTFYPRSLLRQKLFTPDTFCKRHLYTRHLLHQTHFTQDTFYTEHSLHQRRFTPNISQTRSLLDETHFTKRIGKHFLLLKNEHDFSFVSWLTWLELLDHTSMSTSSMSWSGMTGSCVWTSLTYLTFSLNGVTCLTWLGLFDLSHLTWLDLLFRLVYFFLRVYPHFKKDLWWGIIIWNAIIWGHKKRRSRKQVGNFWAVFNSTETSWPFHFMPCFTTTMLCSFGYPLWV